MRMSKLALIKRLLDSGDLDEFIRTYLQSLAGKAGEEYEEDL